MEFEEKNIRKGFMYNTSHDKDIHEWLLSLPERKQSEYIRSAIRLYLKKEEEESQIFEEKVTYDKIIERLNLIEKEIIEIKKPKENGISDPQKQNNQSKEKEIPDNGDYVDATEILKNLGKVR